MAWDRLPELVVAHILQYLSRRDRIAASEVCTSWQQALSAPILWRSMELHLDRDLLQPPDPELKTVDEPLAVHVAQKFGQHLHRLELVWSRRLTSPLHHFPRGAQTEAGSAFLVLLRLQDVQLQELILTDWVYSYKWGYRGKLMYTLANFLKSQKKLEILSLQNACLGLGEALRLLAATLSSGTNILKELNLCGAFRDWQAVHTSTKYLELLGRLTSLTCIRLDYSALSDAVLSVLSQHGVLTYLLVSVRDTDNRQHALSDRAWSLLTTTCPNLRVSFSVVNIAHYEDLCYFLLPSIPLSDFQLLSGSVWDQSRSRNFRSTVRLLLSYYTGTLENVHLHLKNNREMLDDLLLQLLNQCYHLSHLQYDGVLRNMDTVREMCLMQVNTRTNFRSLHVKPRRTLNETNSLIVRDIASKYTSKLAEQHVNLKIEDPSSVIMFC